MTSSESRGQQHLREVITADLVAMGVSGPLRRKVPSLLKPGETVAAMGICTPAGRWWNEARDVQIFVATDRRLILIPTKFLLADTMLEAGEHQPTSVNYRDIRGVKERLGWLESKLDLDVSSGRTIQLTSMRRKAARAAAAAVRRRAPVAPMGL